MQLNIWSAWMQPAAFIESIEIEGEELIITREKGFLWALSFKTQLLAFVVSSVDFVKF